MSSPLMLMTQGKQINLNFTVQVRSADKKMFLYTDNNLTAMTEKKAISLSLSLFKKKSCRTVEVEIEPQALPVRACRRRRS